MSFFETRSYALVRLCIRFSTKFPLRYFSQRSHTATKEYSKRRSTFCRRYSKVKEKKTIAPFEGFFCNDLEMTLTFNLKVIDPLKPLAAPRGMMMMIYSSNFVIPIYQRIAFGWILSPNLFMICSRKCSNFRVEILSIGCDVL